MMKTETPAPASHKGAEREDVRRILNDAVVCDHTLPTGLDLAEEIAPHAAAGVAHVSVTIATDDTPYQRAIDLMADDRVRLAAMEGVVFADTVDGIRRAKAENRLSVGFHFQGTEAVQRNLDNVWKFRELGVGWMLMAYNWQNSAAIGCIESERYGKDYGLSAFGRDLVREMNAAGMIVDVSHTGRRCSLEAVELSARPPMFSHSSARALFDHPRNIDDEQIRAVAEKDGLVGVTGVGEFLGEFERVSAETIFRHIDHMVQLVGDRHVGLGLDYMSQPICDMVMEHLKGAYEKNGMSPPPWRFFHPSGIPDLVALMLDAGYGEAAICNILGENFLRVAGACWDGAKTAEAASG